MTNIGDLPGSLGAQGWTPGPLLELALLCTLLLGGWKSLLPQPDITAVTVARPGTMAFCEASAGGSHSGDCAPQSQEEVHPLETTRSGSCLRNAPFLLPPERREPTPLLGVGWRQRLSARDGGGCRIWARVEYRFCLGGHLGQETGDAPLLECQQLVSQLHRWVLLRFRWKRGGRGRQCFWGGVTAGTAALCHREACLSSKLPRPEPGEPSSTVTR